MWYDSRHKAVDLRPLHSGERVWIPDLNTEAKIESPIKDKPRTCQIQTPRGITRRNRTDIYPITLQLEENGTSSPEEIDVPVETRELSDQTVSTEISEPVTVPIASNTSSAKVTYSQWY